MSEDGVRVHRFEPYADHMAFVISDAEPTGGVFDGDTWGTAEEAWRIAVGSHCIVVGTARYDYVPVTLTVRGGVPVLDPLDDYDHVVEADVVVPSGKLAVLGAMELPSEVEPVPVTPGKYRMRVAYLKTELRPSKCSEDDPGDHLEYRVTMWPVAEDRGVQVLKQGPEPWAY
jgi:hypothetical protein